MSAFPGGINTGSWPIGASSGLVSAGCWQGAMQNLPDAWKQILGSAVTPSYRIEGTGASQVARQQGQIGMATPETMSSAFVTDLKEQARVNALNQQRMDEARKSYMETSQKAAQRFIDPKTSGQEMFDKASGFQKQYEQAALETEKNINEAMKKASAQLAADRAAVNASYNQAIGTVGQDTDRIASDLARAAEANREAARAQGFGTMTGFEGSEGQFAALEEISRQESEQGKFGQIAALQQQASMQKANLLGMKAQTQASLANLNKDFAQMQTGFLMGVGDLKTRAAELGVKTSLANAEMMQQANQNFFAATEMIGRQNVDMLRAAPILGVNISPTLLSMFEFARQYGPDRFPDLVSPERRFGQMGQFMPGQFPSEFQQFVRT